MSMPNWLCQATMPRLPLRHPQPLGHSQQGRHHREPSLLRQGLPPRPGQSTPSGGAGASGASASSATSSSSDAVLNVFSSPQSHCRAKRTVTTQANGTVTTVIGTLRHRRHQMPGAPIRHHRHALVGISGTEKQHKSGAAMPKPKLPPTPTDHEVRALLERYRCPVPFHAVRT
jgi:hypothetical protein